MNLFWLPVLLTMAVSTPAGAEGAAAQDSRSTARALVREGTNQYSLGNWEASRTALAKAWALNPHYAIAGSLADVELKLGRYREAADHLKYALANLPPDHPEKRAEAEATLKECRAHLSAVRISVSELGATVQLDAQELPPETLADELLLDPGTHKVEARKAGYLTSSRAFTAMAGETREIQLELAAQPSPIAPIFSPNAHAHVSPASAPLTDGTGTDHTSRRTWVLVGGSVATAAAAGLGTYFLVRGSSLANETGQLQAQIAQQAAPERAGTHTECDPDAPMRPAETCAALRQNTYDRDIANRNAAISWMAAGALGVATVTTYLLWTRDEHEGTQNGVSVTIAPWLIGARGGAIQVDF